MSYEEAEKIIEEKMDSDRTILNKFDSSTHQDKVDALNMIKENSELLFRDNMEAILTILKKKFKDWKEGNLNLNKELF